MTVGLAPNALTMVVWRCKPKNKVSVHSNPGTQNTGSDWQSFLKSYILVFGMSRRGKCYDNVVSESFFHFLKRERIRRKTYPSRGDARQEVFNYIEMFQSIRRHSYSDDLAPVEFECRHLNKVGIVWEAGGDSYCLLLPRPSGAL